ncbi:uncharacterized protein LOC144859198 [Branchiostoma floridae x Branchiostoma japonicum]
MFGKIQLWRVVLFLTAQWIIGVSSTNTTELYNVTTGNASFAQTSSNVTARGSLPTPLPTASNMTSTQNTTPAQPTAHNTTATGNITTPHFQTLNATAFKQVTTPFANTTKPPFQLPRNVTAPFNTTVVPTVRVNNTTALPVMPTARPANVTMHLNVTVSRFNVTGVVQNVTTRHNVVPTARPMNVTMHPNVTAVPPPVMTGINTTRRLSNATQTPHSPTMGMAIPTGPAMNQTRIMPTGHIVTMAVNRTSSNTTFAVTQRPTPAVTQPPPTTNPPTTIGAFPACTTTCHRYASCVAGGSGKSCVCNAGYSGNGTTCTLASKKVNLEMRMTSVAFTEDLKDRNSEAFRSLSFKVSRQIFVYLKTTSLGDSLLSVTILNFRQGSVVANYNANFKSNATVSDSGVSGALQQAISQDPNNTFGIDVSSLCTKANEDAACGEATGMDQNLIIGLAVGVPVAVIILIIILVCLIRRARNGKEYGGESEGKKDEAESELKKDDKRANSKKDETKDDNKNDKKTISKENGKEDKGQKKGAEKNNRSQKNGNQQGSSAPERNYKRMTFQPARKPGPSDKYEHDLGGIYFPKRYHVPQEPKPTFHYVEGHVQGKPVTVVVPI